MPRPGVRVGRVNQTCDGRALNDDVMDTIFTLLVNAVNEGREPTFQDPDH
jgi:hypothetical protein